MQHKNATDAEREKERERETKQKCKLNLSQNGTNLELTYEEWSTITYFCTSASVHLMLMQLAERFDQFDEP